MALWIPCRCSSLCFASFPPSHCADCTPYPGNPGSTWPSSTLPNSLNNKNEVAGQVLVQKPNFLQQMPFLEGGANFQPIEGGTSFSAAAALGNNDAGVMVGWFENPFLGSPGGILFPIQVMGVTSGPISVQLPLTVPLHSLN